MGKEGYVGKRWTKEEEQFLEESWGTLNVNRIAGHLERTVSAVMQKAARMELGRFTDSGDYISWNQLCKLLGICNDTYKQQSWVANRNFPMRKKRVNTGYIRIGYVDEFWKWAEKHREMLDFSKLEENVLGVEPEWVCEKRRLDFRKRQLVVMTPWSSNDDNRLRHFLKSGKYTYSDLQRMLMRTEDAIRRRIYDLGIQEHPVKAVPVKWSCEDVENIVSMVRNGWDYEAISQNAEKPIRAIRGLMYRYFGTESLGKIRRMENSKEINVCS